jgi:hypothetical protein
MKNIAHAKRPEILPPHKPTDSEVGRKGIGRSLKGAAKPIVGRFPSGQQPVVRREKRSRPLLPLQAPPDVVNMLAKLPDVFQEIAIVEPGGDLAGNWWIVFGCGEHELVVEWRPTLGFGIYELDDETYGGKPMVVKSTADEAAQCVAKLLQPVLHGVT